MKPMNAFIGTKLIHATPMTRGAYNEYRGWTIPANENPEDEGYLVRYSDSYESWSPKAVFEDAYLPVIVNPELPTDAPSISQKMVQDFIVKTETQTLGDKTTVVRAVLRNGFVIVESSSCVSAENYSAELGREICMNKIEDKVWYLLGFLLQTAVNGINVQEPNKGDLDSMSFGKALELARAGCRIARRGWNGKGQYVFLASSTGFHTKCDLSEHNGEEVEVGDMLVIRTAQGTFQPGWLASQADMLADDWFLYTTTHED